MTGVDAPAMARNMVSESHPLVRTQPPNFLGKFLQIAMNNKIYRNLMDMMGHPNPFTEDLLHINSTYNDLILSYWFFYDRFGHDMTKPNTLTGIVKIDRVIRELPNRKKNLTEEQRYREYYRKA